MVVLSTRTFGSIGSYEKLTSLIRIIICYSCSVEDEITANSQFSNMQKFETAIKVSKMMQTLILQLLNKQILPTFYKLF